MKRILFLFKKFFFKSAFFELFLMCVVVFTAINVNITFSTVPNYYEQYHQNDELLEEKYNDRYFIRDFAYGEDYKSRFYDKFSNDAVIDGYMVGFNAFVSMNCIYNFQVESKDINDVLFMSYSIIDTFDLVDIKSKFEGNEKYIALENKSDISEIKIIPNKDSGIETITLNNIKNYDLSLNSYKSIRNYFESPVIVVKDSVLNDIFISNLYCVDKYTGDNYSNNVSTSKSLYFSSASEADIFKIRNYAKHIFGTYYSAYESSYLLSITDKYKQKVRNIKLANAEATKNYILQAVVFFGILFISIFFYFYRANNEDRKTVSIYLLSGCTKKEISLIYFLKYLLSFILCSVVSSYFIIYNNTNHILTTSGRSVLTYPEFIYVAIIIIFIFYCLMFFLRFMVIKKANISTDLREDE